MLSSARRARDLFEDAGVDVVLDEHGGNPAAVIISEANDRDVDRIVMCGRKRSPAGKALFGSVTQRVLLDADRPVMLTDTSAE
jgi:nucleotide-binding universal stress UspA family protein